ncbi:MAG: LuxR C-terminal-related transcriptional regulator [Lacipirellulaceae bacterium]
MSDAPSAWIDRLPKPASKGFDPAAVPDLVVLVGSAGRVATGTWIADARRVLPGTEVAVAVQDAILHHTAEFMKQGATALLTLPSTADRVALELSWLVQRAAATQGARRTAATHRKGYASLTEAETDVLGALMDGMANKQIAQHLAVGLRTVELRRSKIARKMRARSVAQLVRFVCEAT